jgi:pyrimidine operon attenuation protein / uracil phosphoribosyltransferase
MMTLPDPNELVAQLASALAPTLNSESALIGIYTGGAWVAHAIAYALKHAHGLSVPVGEIAVTFHRDDYKRIGLHPQGKSTQLNFSVEGRNVVLVDDVLYTGRTVRAAINEIFDFGRPAQIKLACLLDRGGRELPIEPNFCGAKMPLKPNEAFELSRSPEGILSLSLNAT